MANHSIKSIRVLLNPDYSPMTKALYVFLNLTATDQDEYLDGIDFLAKHFNRSPRQIIRELQILQKQKLIRRKKRVRQNNIITIL